ncbi:unnamed protein product [Lymnaea stagnalis]|uniref:Uncharacterized protein n=1 Tax=Lymnaea stagnalis TaxID=6523 RepID=A0AAV2HEN0_LYMST
MITSASVYSHLHTCLSSDINRRAMKLLICLTVVSLVCYASCQRGRQRAPVRQPSSSEPQQGSAPAPGPAFFVDGQPFNVTDLGEPTQQPGTADQRKEGTVGRGRGQGIRNRFTRRP